MGSKQEGRIFVGGLSWETTDRQLEDAFSRFGKILESQIMVDRESGRPQGFGFVTFSDARGMENAIRDMHGRELDGRVISVNKAQPKLGGNDDPGYGGYRDGDNYSGGGRSGYGSGGGGCSDCFKCGRPRHCGRECPSGGGIGSGTGGRFPSRSKFTGGRGGDHVDRFEGDRFGDRYLDDRYDGGGGGRCYLVRDRDRDRERVDSRHGDVGGRDRYGGDRYMPSGDRFQSDRYAGMDRYPMSGGYGKERSGGGYERNGGMRGGGGDRYGADPLPPRYDGGHYRERPGPYDRPSRPARHRTSVTDQELC